MFHRAVLFMLVVLLAMPWTVMAGAVTPPRAAASVATANGRIIFRDFTTGQLYTVNTDGTALRQVTHLGFNAHPDWSPDGRSIAYASTRGGGNFAIWIARADGSHARQVTPNDPNSADFNPHFTPDGGTVLFQNCLGPDCDGGISAVRVDGSDLHAITPNSGNSYNDAVPSPAGSQMVFMRWHVDGITMRLYVRPIRGGTERPITPARLEASVPDWAPNGGRIVFSSNLVMSRPNGAIYTVRPDGTGLRKLTNPPWPLEDLEASYSPDGSRLVFSSDRRYPDRCCFDLYTMSANGAAMRRIPLASKAAVDASWGTAPPLTDSPQSTTPVTIPADTKAIPTAGVTARGGGMFTSVPVRLRSTSLAGNTPDQCVGC